METVTNNSLIEESGKLFYSISEVADEFGIPAHTLRFWEKEFDHLLSPQRQGNKRAYTSKDIRTLRSIYTLLKVKKMTLKGAKEVLRKGVPSDVDHLGLLTERLDILHSKVKTILFEIENSPEK